MVSFRDIASESYFRFNYDNDYFSATDKNYTQGYSFELVAPFLRKNPINYLFYKPGNSEVKYCISVEHIGFTPKNIVSPEIQSSDRPFAAAIMLKSFSIANDTVNKSRFVSALSLGIIGPGAFGEEMQKGIHEATGNKIPFGWRNQIKNDVVLNYQVDFEKEFFRYRNLFALHSNVGLKLGTLYTNASVGFNTTIGLIENPYSSEAQQKTFQIYLNMQPLVNAIGYDATLQGGLFNRESPYTIASEDIERITTQFNYGLVLKTRTLYFEYSRTTISREFDFGKPAKWGGIRVGFTF
ncbi:hypothetical protein BXY75_2281 [Ulvibacter antarcticus]|uniref:Lipid A deacylase LpxR family protein n=2 Tax=Ulvibacter antarcticus TaxID=442714 RepID=A0A3L9YI60_9FLAO|nr:hypothetical protein BXY75_2281 [Ulvibacter antarcticus]